MVNLEDSTEKSSHWEKDSCQKESQIFETPPSAIVLIEEKDDVILTARNWV